MFLGEMVFLLIFSLQRNVRIPRQKLESQLRRNLYATQKAFPRVKKYIMQKQRNTCTQIQNTSHSQMLGKYEYGGGPIFKVVLEC